MSPSAGDAAPLDEAELASLFEAARLSDDPTPVLVAVSGGPDSIALMHALALWCRSAGGPPLKVATVDHGLRAASRPEAEAVGEAARALGLPHAILTWTGRAAGPVSQAAAREARYRLLLAHADEVGARRLVTAHTCDDQAETILMRLADGSGIGGLAGMVRTTRRGAIAHLRPFLPIAKERLVATCRARGWGFLEDPSNADPRFARARWRALMPALAAEGLDATRLTRLAARLRRADLALQEATEAAARRLVSLHETGLAIDADALFREPEEIGLRVLLRSLASLAPDSSQIRLARAEAALAALRVARNAGRPAQRTLAGLLLTLDRTGRLVIAPEPPRRRGRAGRQDDRGSSRDPVATAPHSTRNRSLGIG